MPENRYLGSDQQLGSVEIGNVMLWNLQLYRIDHFEFRLRKPFENGPFKRNNVIHRIHQNYFRLVMTKVRQYPVDPLLINMLLIQRPAFEKTMLR